MTYAKLDYSVNPVTITVLYYSKVKVNWAIPTTASTGVTGLRLVRSTDGFSETSEDGVILFTDSTLTNSARFDSTNNNYYFVDDGSISPLVGGQYIYYNFWVFYNNQWQEAGRQLTVLAKDVTTSSSSTSLTKTSTHDKFIESLPRIFTSSSQNSLDSVDTGSDLYAFFQGFSYTLDELVTSAKLVTPAQNFRKAAPVISTLALKSYGFTAELNLPVQNQKKLASKALYIVTRRGTLAGVQTWAESVTGFNSRISQNNNLVLGMVDSYLDNNYTSFIPIFGTLSSGVITPPSPLSQYALSSFVRAGTPNFTTASISLPSTVSAVELVGNPSGGKIAISGGAQYDISAYFQKAGISNAITPTLYVNWYGPADDNNAISTSGPIALSALTTSWARLTATVTAPANAISATFAYYFTRTGSTSSTGYVYLTMLQMSLYDGVTHQPYYEPRGVAITFEPRKANLLVNPSFQNNTAAAGWTISGGTVTTPLLTDGGGPSIYGNGTKKLRIVGPGSGDTTITQTVIDTFFTKSGVRGYTFSFYAKASTTTTMTMGIGFSGGGLETSQSITLTTSWQRFTLAWQMPGTSITNVSMYVSIKGTLAGATVEFDASQFELGYSATEYFDGNAKFGYWTTSGGEQDATAQSVQYPNLDLKISRVRSDIKKYLPPGTPYWIQYFGPDSFVRYSGIS